MIKLSLLTAELLAIAIKITIKSFFKWKTIVVNVVSDVFDETNYEIY